MREKEKKKKYKHKVMYYQEELDPFLWPDPHPNWQSPYLEPYGDYDPNPQGHRFWNTRYKSYKIPRAWTRRKEFKKRHWSLEGPRMMRYMFQHHLDELLDATNVMELQNWLAFPEVLSSLATSYGDKGLRLYEKIRRSALDLRMDNYQNIPATRFDTFRVIAPQRTMRVSFPRTSTGPVFPNLYRMPGLEAPLAV